MEYIDLISLLKAFGTKGIEKVEVYGKITRKLPKPTNIFDSVVLSETGIFVEMSVFAVNLGYHQSFLKSNGIMNKNSIYMVKGNICTFIEPAGKVLPEWYTIKGHLRFGSKDTTNNYVTLLNFGKTGSDWTIHPCIPTDIAIESWERESECYYWINKCWEANSLVQPDYLNTLPRMNSVIYSNPVSLEASLSGTTNGVTITAPNTVLAPKFNKECRETIKEPNKLLREFEAKLDEAKSSKVKFIKGLALDYSYNDDDYYLEYMLNSLVTNLKHKPTPQAMTGQAILKKYLDNYKGSGTKYIGKISVADYLISIFDEISKFVLNHNVVINADGIAWDVCKTAFGNKQILYIGIISIITGVSFSDLLQAYETCEQNKIDIIRVINENPYILQFVSSLRFDEIEKIALCFQKHNDTRLNSFRNIAMLNDFINAKSEGSTVYSKDRISNGQVGIILSKVKLEQTKSYGTYLSVPLRANIDNYLKPINRPSDVGYETEGFKPLNSYQFIKKMSLSDLLVAIDDYNKSGVGIVLPNGMITSNSLLEKELFVFNTMFKLGSIQYNYKREDIDKYIAEYEGIVGFKLEDRQRQAVYLSVNAGFIVAGSAGSGKTTVSNCIVYVLNKLDPNLDIQFAAPTGKAAKRMQEVVKKEVKTLHSKFKIGLVEENEFTVFSEDLNGSNIAYFFDEGAMITIDLLYQVLKKIDITSSRVFLFGDFNQLPPIGKGLPFKNLLRFMPCVFLNVSKRAADGSNITKNSNYINEYSDSGNWHPLENGDDFFAIPCRSNDIQRVIYDLCAYYLGKSNDSHLSYISKSLGLDSMPKVDNIVSDDIQVVSPLAKENYNWGTIALNKVLQPLFNPARTFESTFVYQVSDKSPSSKFSINDRVIHIDKNMYSMQWYKDYKDGHFEKMYGFGICNGEVGKIVGFYNSTECTFISERGYMPDDFNYPANLRDDSTWYGDNKWFVVVEYYDYISDDKFYILYRAELNDFVQSNEGIVFKGDDLTKLNLFYAGTTHKLQGSQAKIIICPLDVVSYNGFITREMIYTMVTRAECLVFLVGSVDNSPSSMLTRARKDIASQGTTTIGEVIIG